MQQETRTSELHNNMGWSAGGVKTFQINISVFKMLDCSYLVLPATYSGYKQNCCKLPGLLLLSSKYYSTRRAVLWKLFVCCICQVLPPATAAVDIPLSLISTSQNTNLSLPVQIWAVWCLVGMRNSHPAGLDNVCRHSQNCFSVYPAFRLINAKSLLILHRFVRHERSQI